MDTPALSFISYGVHVPELLLGIVLPDFTFERREEAEFRWRLWRREHDPVYWRKPGQPGAQCRSLAHFVQYEPPVAGEQMPVPYIGSAQEERDNQ